MIKKLQYFVALFDLEVCDHDCVYAYYRNLFDRGEEGEEEIRAITDYCVRTLCVCTAACNHWSSAFAIVVCLMG